MLNWLFFVSGIQDLAFSNRLLVKYGCRCFNTTISKAAESYCYVYSKLPELNEIDYISCREEYRVFFRVKFFFDPSFF